MAASITYLWKLTILVLYTFPRPWLSAVYWILVSSGEGRCQYTKPQQCKLSSNKHVDLELNLSNACCQSQYDKRNPCEHEPLPAKRKRCKSVVAYISMPTLDSQLGLEILSHLANSNLQIGDDSTPWHYLNGRVVQAALRDIPERPYFQRVWVVQEAAVAPQVRMQADHLFFEWSGGASTRKSLARIKLAELSPSWQQSTALRDSVDFRPIRELLEQSLAAEAKRNGVVENPSFLDVVHSIRHRQVATHATASMAL